MARIEVPGAFVFDGQHVRFVLRDGSGEIDLTELSVKSELARQQLLGIMATGFQRLVGTMGPDPAQANQAEAATAQDALRQMNSEADRIAKEAEAQLAASTKSVVYGTTPST